MATIGDSITGDENVNREFATDLTIVTNPSLVTSGSHEERVETFLRRMLPVVFESATHPVQALVPWVCDVLQSKQSLEVYGQDIRDFTTHMQRFGIQPLEVTADHLRLYKAALRDAGLAGATIARKLSVLRGMYRQFAVKKLIPWEVAQDIAAVESPRVQKNTTPALTEKQAVELLHAPDTSTLRGLRDKALLQTLFITACRVSAITRTKVGPLEFDGTEWFLNVIEKRNKKQRKILLEAARSILAYTTAAEINHDREGPLFRRFSPDSNQCQVLLEQVLLERGTFRTGDFTAHCRSRPAARYYFESVTHTFTPIASAIRGIVASVAFGSGTFQSLLRLPRVIPLRSSSWARLTDSQIPQ